MKVDKPWGYELIFADTDKYVGKVLFIKKGGRLSKQYHEKKDETIFLNEGRMELFLDGGRGAETVVLEPGEAQRIEPGVIHRMAALEDCYVFEVSTTELDDVVRLEDDFGRAEQDS